MRAAVAEPAISSGLRIPLSDGESTAIHIIRYDRQHIKPRLVTFDFPVLLSKWCQQNSIDFAMGGGYTYLYCQLMGEYWKAGVKLKSSIYPKPWDQYRGSAYFSPEGEIKLDKRLNLPRTPDGDLIQAGPLLVKNRVSLVGPAQDPEDFTGMAQLFDPNPAVGRHPRAAIGINDEYVWSVVSDGRSPENAGMTWSEMADFMISLGAIDALNLDGGSAASLIAYGQLINTSMGQERPWPEGRQIKSAIVFESI